MAKGRYGMSDVPKNMGFGAGKSVEYNAPKHKTTLNEKLNNTKVESGLSMGLSSAESMDSEHLKITQHSNLQNPYNGNAIVRPEPMGMHSQGVTRRGKSFNMR